MSGVMTAGASDAFATSAVRLADGTADGVSRKDTAANTDQASQALAKTKAATSKAAASADQSLPTIAGADTVSLSPNAKALLMMNLAGDPTNPSGGDAGTGIVPILWTNPQSGETDQIDTAGRSHQSNSILV
ncbi:MAG TPA: hypothetical protein VNT30_05425 [Stellaceae bacterium]|nr:hypothetical protein [Stellaceae bacterium]